MSIHMAIDNYREREIIMSAIREASEVTGVSERAIRGRERGDKMTAQARQAAMWEAHNQGLSYPVIGRFFRRDHTTVMHGVQAAARRFRANTAIACVPVFKSCRSA